MKDTMGIVKYLEEYNLFYEGVTKKIKNEMKEKKEDSLVC